MNKSKVIFVLIIIICVIILYLFVNNILSKTPIGKINNNITNDLINNPYDDYVIKTNNEECFKSYKYKCTKVTSGEFNPPPVTVCGCPPTCKNNEYLISNLAEGRWPDNSSKASYSCSKELPA